MRIKTFRGRSATQALAKVKNDLGDEAVILSSKTVEIDGDKLHEIMAAIEHDQHPPAEMPATKSNTAPAAAAHRRDIAPTKDLYLTEALDDSTRFSREWGQIKGHLMALMKPQMDMEQLEPRQRVALQYLEREGVDDQVVMTAFRKLREDDGNTILPILEGIAPVRSFGNGQWIQKMHAFAGPHGAGKTTSLIRLALLEKKINPKARICLVSADQGKGRVVLRHYAELSSLAFREVAAVEDFRQLCDEAGEFDKIFIDLPGMRPGTCLGDWLNERDMLFTDVAVHLVLSPIFNAAQYDAFSDAYLCESVKSIVWTKLDEACNYGAMINMAYTSGLPVSALSFGSGLKNSMVPAEAEMVWRLLFKHQLPGDGCKPESRRI